MFIAIKFGGIILFSSSVFYVFCGCDSTISFLQKPSTQMFHLCMTYSQLSAVIQQLSRQPSKKWLIGVCIPAIEMFVNHCYGHGSLKEHSPFLSSLKYNVLRIPYQSGWLWDNTLSHKTVPPVTEWVDMAESWKLTIIGNYLMSQWHNFRQLWYHVLVNLDLETHYTINFLITVIVENM